jgi:hypothetical protein
MKRLLALALALCALPALAQGDPERLKTAKTLFFDKKYAEAREIWLQVKSSAGADADTAAFWAARCSESLGDRPRALREYGEFLARRSADRALNEEARTNRVSLAARLVEAGQRQHLPILTEGLSDPSKTVRYLAALQLGNLGPELGKAAVPILKAIVAEEKDEDLVERATLRLIKVDPTALGSRSVRPPTPSTPGRPPAAWTPSYLRLRIFEKGRSEAKVAVNLPFALAELAFKSLPDDALRELRRKGYDSENFWDRLRRLGPTDIIEIVGDQGERIKIWIE